jgi:hypothetical protein
MNEESEEEREEGRKARRKARSKAGRAPVYITQAREQAKIRAAIIIAPSKPQLSTFSQ